MDGQIELLSHHYTAVVIFINSFIFINVPTSTSHKRFLAITFKIELDVFAMNVILLSQQCGLLSRNLKAREFWTPHPCLFLVSCYKQKYAMGERGERAGGVRGREGGMDAGCDVTTWPWQGYKSRSTRLTQTKHRGFLWKTGLFWFWSDKRYVILLQLC